ncbi:MAG: hypothetical protein F6K30_06400 [Cyanothece sp. SIO2G6]|nr:hypothetical protein [Cyanothece sp. SIO2G6]
MQTIPTNYLQYLISDPQYGYLFPHRLALPVFGLQNRHQIDKFRPQLEEGTDFITLPNPQGGKPNLFYTLTGLGKLCDLIQTPQAAQFRQELAAALQPGNVPSSRPPLPPPSGALVPTVSPVQASDPVLPPGHHPGAYSQTSPPQHHPLHPFPLVASYAPTDHQGTSHHSPYDAPSSAAVSQPVPEPVAQLSSHLQAHLAPAVAAQVSRQVRGAVGAIAANQPSFQEVHQMTAAAQDRAVGYFAQGVTQAQEIQAATAQIAGDRTFINSETTTTRTETWLDRQDTFAFVVIAISLSALLAAGVWAVLALSSRNRPQAAPQSVVPVEVVDIV